MKLIVAIIRPERLNEVLTFLEPHALTRRAEHARQSERRRGPRVPIGFPVRIVEKG